MSFFGDRRELSSPLASIDGLIFTREPNAYRIPGGVVTRGTASFGLCDTCLGLTDRD